MKIEEPRARVCWRYKPEPSAFVHCGDFIARSSALACAEKGNREHPEIEHWVQDEQEVCGRIIGNASEN